MPTDSVLGQSNTSVKAEKAAAAGRDKDAEQARANAERWRQWADAAAEALGRR